MKLITSDEVVVAPRDLLVSKTDLAGRITYVNAAFERISGYTRTQALGKPHNLVRHPLMPRAVFGYLWDRLTAEREVFAYVVNRTAHGAFYWVFAHVTASRDAHGKVVGYHSARRAPNRAALPEIEALYARLRAIEADHPDRAIVASSMASLLETTGGHVGYQRLMFALEARQEAA
jgi:PAS domain S-box-containing protein